MVVSVFLLSRLLVDLNIPVTTADDPLLPIPPEDAPVDETEAAPLGTSRRISGVVSGGIWIHQGPGPILSGQVENVAPENEVSGAIHTVAAHPNDPDILYAGAVNGGI